jgi:CheY-like chemotaxis protein
VSVTVVGPSLRVLTVGGDPADLAVLASVAAAHRFELHVCASPDRLLLEAARGEHDVVVLDVSLPAAGAYEACALLKSAPRTATLPVVLTTTHAGVETSRRAIAAGCDELVAKPIDRHGLAVRLLSFARLRRAWAEHSRRALLEHLRAAASDGVVDPALVARLAAWAGSEE